MHFVLYNLLQLIATAVLHLFKFELFNKQSSQVYLLARVCKERQRCRAFRWISHLIISKHTHYDCTYNSKGGKNRELKDHMLARVNHMTDVTVTQYTVRNTPPC